jgi:hypothetical protein
MSVFDDVLILAGALRAAQQLHAAQHKDDAVVRDIVADAARSPPAQPSSALGSDAHNAGPKGGWVEPRSLGDWQRQVGVREADRLVDAQDRRDRAAKRGGGR